MRVSFYACSSYEDQVALMRAVEGAFRDSIDCEATLRSKRVVVKPNLVMGKPPQAAATTHPALFEAILSFVKRYTEDVTVLECPGGLGNSASVESVYRVTGIRAVCDRLGVPIAREAVPVTVTVKDPYVARELTLASQMLDADVFLNVGKLKSHSLTTFTGCAKNLYGAIPGLGKVEGHARYADVDEFSDLICDINRTLVPTLSILDAVVGMEGNGPTGGEPRAIGGVLAGTNAFAVDLIAARLIGVPAKEAPILASALRHSLVAEEVECVGDDYTKYVLSDFRLADAQRFSILRQMPNLKLLRRLLEPRPVISDRCVGCGECVRLCPEKTIVLRNKGGKRRAYIRSRACIRCYCCQELCPVKAVDTKSRRFLKL